MKVVSVVCTILFLWASVVTLIFETVGHYVLSRPSQHSTASTGAVAPSLDVSSPSENIRVYPSDTHTFMLDPSVAALALRASQSVKMAWDLEEDSSLTKSRFCDNYYIAELDMCTEETTRSAMKGLGVDESLLPSFPPEIVEKFSEFAFCLTHERCRLNKARRDNFDRNWGLDSGHHFGVRQKNNPLGVCMIRCSIEERVDVLLLCAMGSAFRRHETSLSLLQGAVGTIDFPHSAPMIGVYLLQCFIDDVLGSDTGAAGAFANKTMDEG